VVLFFKASEVVAGEEEDHYVVSFFRQGPAGPHYLTLQRSKEITEQDRLLGIIDVHVELDDQARGTYGGIAGFQLLRDRVSIQLDSAAAVKLGAEEVHIRFDIEACTFAKLQVTLGHIFADHACYSDKTA
jgi:hypothetical protein